VGFYVVDWQP